MKKIYFLLILMSFGTALKAQQKMYYSVDSTRIQYASFDVNEAQESDYVIFMSNLLHLDCKNTFYPVDTIVAPNTSYLYVKYRQLYDGIPVENTLITLTYYNGKIIRFSGNYLPVNNLLIPDSLSETNAISVYKSYYSLTGDTNFFDISTCVFEKPDVPSEFFMCYKIWCNNPQTMDKHLYVNVADYSVIAETNFFSSGFNGTVNTYYNGVRDVLLNNINGLGYMLKDDSAAVMVVDMNWNQTSIENSFIPNQLFNTSPSWGFEDNLYPRYVYDAYWSATLFPKYLQINYNCPRDFFQPNPHNYSYIDPTTWLLIAKNTFVDNTHCTSFSYTPGGRESSHRIHKNAIIIGSPGPDHNPKASIDEVVHEFAHIFAQQSWYPKHSNEYDAA